MLKREYSASSLLLRLLYHLGEVQTSNLRQEVKRKTSDTAVNSGLCVVPSSESSVLLSLLLLPVALPP